MKTYVITLSKRFPAKHGRVGDLTFFAEKLVNALDDVEATLTIDDADDTSIAIYDRKIHTIRANYPFWEKRITEIKRGKACLSIRQWSGRPYNSPQVEIARLVQPIGIQRIELHYHSENDTITARIDGREWLDADCYEIAKNDGLNTDDFKEWFFGWHPKEDKVFHGVIIHFTDFRY